MDIQADFQFARNEFPAAQAAQLRYVASINPDAPKKQFIAAAVKAGYHPSTTDIQFTKSRRMWVADFDDCMLAPDGRLITTETRV